MEVQETLGIFWHLEDGKSEEAAGIYFFGYCRSSNPSIDVDWLRLLWTSLKGEIQTSIMVIPERDSFESVESGSVFICDVRLDCWPNDKEWRSAVEETLRTIARPEGSVAWCGAEPCSWSPDELNPKSGCGLVYAGFADNRVATQPITAETAVPHSLRKLLLRSRATARGWERRRLACNAPKAHDTASRT